MGNKVEQTLSGNVRDYLSNLKHGQQLDISQCAKFANTVLRNAGYDIQGNAWDQTNLTPVINGYNIINKDNSEPYNEQKYHEMNQQAAKEIYDRLDTNTLDTTQVFPVNMYHPSSPYKETAYTESKNHQYGTHTGILYYPIGESGRSGGKHGSRQWRVGHNIGGKFYSEPFHNLQYSGGKTDRNGSYVTSVSTASEGGFWNKAKRLAKSLFSFENGGRLIPKQKANKYF